MNNSYSGKVIGVRLGTTWLRCQTEAKLSQSAAVTEDDACKPDFGSDTGVSSITRTLDSVDWQLTFSAKTLADGAPGTYKALATAFVQKKLAVEIMFMTNTGVRTAGIAEDFVFDGSGIITAFDINAPATGSSTYDVTIVGNGDLTFTSVPRTT